jgi:hypothetical protein
LWWKMRYIISIYILYQFIYITPGNTINWQASVSVFITVCGAPSVTNSILYGPPDLHNILYQTGQRTVISRTLDLFSYPYCHHLFTVCITLQ